MWEKMQIPKEGIERQQDKQYKMEWLIEFTCITITINVSGFNSLNSMYL